MCVCVSIFLFSVWRIQFVARVSSFFSLFDGGGGRKFIRPSVVATAAAAFNLIRSGSGSRFSDSPFAKATAAAAAAAVSLVFPPLTNDEDY